MDGEMHVVKDVLLRQFSDTRSLFLGMFIAILSVEIYCWLENRPGLKIRMPDTVPPNVAASFSALIPAIITTTAIATLGFVFHQITGMYLYDAVYQVVQQPLERVVQSLPDPAADVRCTAFLGDWYPRQPDDRRSASRCCWGDHRQHECV